MRLTLPRTPSQLLSWLLPLLLMLLLTHVPADPDMWWHLRNGQEMVQLRRILLEDRFSYTRYGAPWVNVFWLSDLLLYGIYRVSSYFGLAFFAALVGAILFTLFYQRAKATPYLSALLVLLLAIAIAPFWSVRPQILSFLLLACLSIRLEHWRFEPRPAPWLLLLFLLWANLHGGFIWGYLYLLAFLSGELLERRLRPDTNLLRLAGWTFLSLPFTLLNPNGLAIWRLPFHTVDVSMGIYEWLSPDFHRPFLHPLLWVLFLYILGLSLRRTPARLSQTLPLLGFAYMGFVSQRAMGPFLVVLTPALLETWEEIGKAWPWVRARAAPAYLQTAGLGLRALQATLAIGLGLSLILRTAALSSPEAVHRDYPQAAVQWLRENRPPGRLFNAYNWGGYLTWTLPQYPVFIDGRADLYGDEIIAQWQAIVSAEPQAWELLDRWQIQIILLEPSHPILRELPQRGWKIVYQDSHSILLLRENAHVHLSLRSSH